MKLSEAIRAGSKRRPQNFGSLFVGLGAGKTCALGAAAEGYGVLGACIHAGSLDPLCGQGGTEALRLIGVRCPSKGECWWDKFGTMYVTQLIAHLNDVHCWSREAIAEWVETVEKKLEAEKAKADAPKVEAPAPSEAVTV